MTDTIKKAHERFMSEALKEARKAAVKGEAPIGAVVVVGGKVVARAHNLRETAADPTAHAELIAIRKASKKLDKWRLQGACVYVTLEPCAMCAGAMVLARIEELIYAADDPKAGAIVSLYNIGRDTRLNHTFKVTKGVLKEEAETLLKKFFNQLRKK